MPGWCIVWDIMCCGLSSISGYLCAGLVNGLEFEMIYKKFAIEIGRCLDVNYIEFCKMVDMFAQNRWDDPTGKVALQRKAFLCQQQCSSTFHRHGSFIQYCYCSICIKLRCFFVCILQYLEYQLYATVVGNE